MITTFADAAAAAEGRNPDYEKGWADATRAAAALAQRAVDEWYGKGLIGPATGLTQLRDAISRQRPAL